MKQQNKNSDLIQFDVLIKAFDSASIPDSANIDQYYPSKEIIEKCRIWLSAKGVSCHVTDFGLVCYTPKRNFEQLFSTTLTRLEFKPGMPEWSCSASPKAPSEIEEYIDQITIPGRPESFP